MSGWHGGFLVLDTPVTDLGQGGDGASATRDISAVVTWTSGTPAIATVSNTGLVAGMTEDSHG